MTTKFKNHAFSILGILCAVLLFISSSSSKKTTSPIIYQEIKKKDAEPYKISYDLPIITPTNGTKQTQTKGGVTITCEVIPFDVTINDEIKREVFYADPNMPGYDRYEVSHIPKPNVLPKKFGLNIKIKNNQDRILKVRETALLLQIDGVTYNVPEASLQEWYAGMIIKNGEFNYRIQGPEYSSLINAKLVYLFINDVPTIMDEGGNIKKRENFEWFFECKKQIIQKDDQKTYTYENSLIESKRCDKCSGTGTDPSKKQCTNCKGTGKSYANGSAYNCIWCGGKGYIAKKCIECKGNGTLSFPKSPMPPRAN